MCSITLIYFVLFELQSLDFLLKHHQQLKDRQQSQDQEFDSKLTAFHSLENIFQIL